MTEASYNVNVLLKFPRFRPGETVKREISRYQRTPRRIIEHSAWAKLCNEILQDIQAPKPINQEAIQLSDDALNALQYAAEDYLTNVFKLADETRAATVKRESLWSTDVHKAAVLESRNLVKRNLEFKFRRREFEWAHKRAHHEIPDWEWKAALHLPEDAEEDPSDELVFE
jgi:histone H3/H4